MIGPDYIVSCTLCDGLLVVTARDTAIGIQDVMVGLSAEDWPFHFCALTTCPHCGRFVWLNRMERVGGGFGDQEGLEARYPSARQVHNPHPDTLAMAVLGEEWASDGEEWHARWWFWLLFKPTYRVAGPIGQPKGPYAETLRRLLDLSGGDAASRRPTVASEVPTAFSTACLAMELGERRRALENLARIPCISRAQEELGPWWDPEVCTSETRIASSERFFREGMPSRVLDEIYARVGGARLLRDGS